MNFELNDQSMLQAIAPWDLAIIVQGQTYPTRRPTVGMIARLEALTEAAAPGEPAAHKFTEALELVRSMFLDPKPNIDEWAWDDLSIVLAVYLSAFTEQAKKNSKSVATTTRAA